MEALEGPHSHCNMCLEYFYSALSREVAYCDDHVGLLVCVCLRVYLWDYTYIFTARCYASAVLAMGLCPSLCLSVTSRCSTKTAKRRITQTTPHDSPGTLVFGRQRSPRNSTGVTPCGGAKYRWRGSKSSTFDK